MTPLTGQQAPHRDHHGGFAASFRRGHPGTPTRLRELDLRRFLIDFVARLLSAPKKRTYFIDERGWLDLVGSIPTLSFFNLSALLRLARLSADVYLAATPPPPQLSGAQRRLR